MPFQGFPPGKVRWVPVPAPFFTQLLPAIDHLGELKVVLYAMWRLSLQEGEYRYLRRADFAADQAFMAGLAPEAEEEAQQRLDEALQRAVARQVLLTAEVDLGAGPEPLYFLNSPKGRAAADALRRGLWRPTGDPARPLQIYLDRPNIFRLYEEHIGPLTPLIAERLAEAEQEFPQGWIEEAFRIAVANNVRRWRYIEAILEAWKTEGRDDRTVGRDSEKDRRRYREGPFAEFFE